MVSAAPRSNRACDPPHQPMLFGSSATVMDATCETSGSVFA
jgi:hypothetical protein